MSLQVRRVVTGHDAAGRAVIQQDDVARVRLNPNGGGNATIWTTVSFPARDNNESLDGADRQLESNFPLNGTTFRIIEFAPGNTPRIHRTNTLDYVLILSGEIDMLVDDEASTHMKAGDVMIQRGTNHGWVNKSSRPCSIAFITIDANPVAIDGKTLEATMH